MLTGRSDGAYGSMMLLLLMMMALSVLLSMLLLAWPWSCSIVW